MAAACLSLSGAVAGADVRSNTQARLPWNLYFADLNGDGSSDLLQVGANRLFAFRTDYEGSPILHAYFDQKVSRLLVGDFTAGGWEHGKDQVCGLFEDGMLRCYAINAEGNALNWWFEQPSFVATDEQGVVGDFDGDGADDVLAYKPATGEIRAYTRMVDGVYFNPMPGFTLGNLAGSDRTGKQLLAGELGQAAGRSDLLLVDLLNGRVSRFDAVTDPAGKKTFWWAFDSALGAVRSDEDLSVARLESGSRDGLVPRSRVSGAVRLKRVEFGGGQLVDLPGINTASLVQAASGKLHFAKMARFPAEPGGLVRDGVFFFSYTDGMAHRYDARWDGSRQTYWWAYRKARPALNSGWPTEVRREPWTVVLCKFSDQLTVPQNAAFWRQAFSTQAGSVASYLWDMSYGSLDVSSNRIYGAYTMSYTSTEVAQRIDAVPQTWFRADSLRICKEAVARGGRTLPDSRVVYYLGARAGSGGIGGNFVADTQLNQTMPLAHEMGHAYGINDSIDDRGNWYGDPWDLMSKGQGFTPSVINAGNRIFLGLLPSARVKRLVPGEAGRT